MKICVPPKNGWMIVPLFTETLEHFKKHTRYSKEDSVVVKMRIRKLNHCSLDTVIWMLLYGEHRLVFLKIPPHHTHKLLHLAVSIRKSFKSSLVVFNDWIAAKVGCRITI